MNNEPEAPQWMKDMFSELSVMLEELFPDHEELLFSDSDTVDLEQMQRALDKQPIHADE